MSCFVYTAPKPTVFPQALCLNSWFLCKHRFYIESSASFDYSIPGNTNTLTLSSNDFSPCWTLANQEALKEMARCPNSIQTNLLMTRGRCSPDVTILSGQWYHYVFTIYPSHFPTSQDFSDFLDSKLDPQPYLILLLPHHKTLTTCTVSWLFNQHLKG